MMYYFSLAGKFVNSHSKTFKAFGGKLLLGKPDPIIVYASTFDATYGYPGEGPPAASQRTPLSRVLRASRVRAADPHRSLALLEVPALSAPVLSALAYQAPGCQS